MVAHLCHRVAAPKPVFQWRARGPARACASPRIIGVDLGTTNSGVAALREGEPVMLRLDGDCWTIPSAVHLGEARCLLL